MQKAPYDQLSEVEDFYWYHESLRALARDFLKMITCGSAEKTAILDVGSGTGSMSGVLSEFGDLTCVENWDYAIELCRLTHPHVQVMKGSAMDLAQLFPDGSFDVATYFNVLAHQNVTNDQDALHAAARVLKPGGHVFLVEPAFHFLERDNDKFCSMARRYSRAQLHDKLERAGFDIVRSSYLNSVSFFPVLLIALWQRVFPQKCDKQTGELVPLPSLLNNFLKACMALERQWIRFAPMPLGVSVLVIGKKSCQ